MLKWVPYALIRVTLFYVVGILFAIYQGDQLDKETGLLLATVGITVYFVLWIVLRKSSFERLNLLFSISGFGLIFLLGFLNLKYSDQSLDSSHILHHNEIEAYTGTVQERHYQTEKTNRYLISINGVRRESWTEAKGKVYLYVNKSFENTFKPGDQLLVYGSPKELQQPMNPGEFDYKRFLSFKNIYHQDYSNGNNLEQIGHLPPNWFLATSNSIREWAVNKLELAIPEEREQTIALALILGVKDGLTDEIKNAYSASGAMHVLAVSGLHVGIIYFIVLLTFGRLQKSNLMRWMLALISLSVLWLYAAVTGFSPSVLRAVTMFSFIALAKASGRTTNIYNTLAASGLLLLAIDPYLIMSVGFQLSYLAVLGIVYFQPKIYLLFIPENKMVDKIWVITSVSIAAQLATFSLGMLYFHQFPTFFLLSNLVVIPGAFLILGGGLTVLLLSFSSMLFSIGSFLLTKLIFGINFCVFWLESVPNSLIQNIYIDTFQTWLLMLTILSLFFISQYKSFKYLIVSFLCVVIFMSTRIIWLNDNLRQDRITLYRINDHTAIDFISAGKSLLVTDSLLWSDIDKKRFHIIPNQLRSAVSQKKVRFLKNDQKSFDVLSWKGIDILILKAGMDSWSVVQETDFDLVVLAKDFKGSIQNVKNRIKFGHLILDGSLKGYVADRLLAESKYQEINIHSIYHDGAREITL